MLQCGAPQWLPRYSTRRPLFVHSSDNVRCRAHSGECVWPLLQRRGYHHNNRCSSAFNSGPSSTVVHSGPTFYSNPTVAVGSHCGCSPAVLSSNVVYAPPAYQIVGAPHMPASPDYVGPAVTSNAPASPSGCGCQSAAGSIVNGTIVYPDSITAMPQPQSPFSLSGHVRPEVAGSNVCEAMFLSCCRSGGTNCMTSYIACQELTGEKIRHFACPPIE